MNISKAIISTLTVFWCTLSLANGANQGTGKILSMNLNLNNCEGNPSINMVVTSGTKIDNIIAEYGPIRVCYPNQELLAFTQNPQPADPNSNITILFSSEGHQGSALVIEDRPIFIIALKNGLDQPAGKTRFEVYQSLANGIEIVQGVDPSINEAVPVDPGDTGLESSVIAQ